MRLFSVFVKTVLMRRKPPTPKEVIIIRKVIKNIFHENFIRAFLRLFNKTVTDFIHRLNVVF